jgi:hypothetical protein
MKTVGSEITVTHLDEPVSIQLLRTVKLRPWLFFSRRVFLTIMAIRYYESLGAFDEPARYIVIAHRIDKYELYKFKNEAAEKSEGN